MNGRGCTRIAGRDCCSSILVLLLFLRVRPRLLIRVHPRSRCYFGTLTGIPRSARNDKRRAAFARDATPLPSPSPSSPILASSHRCSIPGRSPSILHGTPRPSMPMRSVNRILVALTLAPVAGAAQSIDTLALEAHAAFLASDSLGGRANGSAGQRIAAEYLVGQLRRIGVRGAFGGGAYLQPLPLTRFDVDGGATRLIVRRDARADTIAASEFHHQGGAPEAFAAFRGALVDFGTSIAAADALSGAEVRGHVVAVTAARGGNLPALLDSLQARGASAAIVVLPDSQLYRRLRNARGASRFHVRAPLGGDNDRRMPVLLASPAAGRVLGVGTGVPGVPGVPGATSAPAAPRRLGAAQLEVRVARRDVEAANVAGLLPGTDPSRRDEPIVLVAHYDHIGFAEPVDGDSLYNGFMDNAVGAATLL